MSSSKQTPLGSKPFYMTSSADKRKHLKEIVHRGAGLSSKERTLFMRTYETALRGPRFSLSASKFHQSVKKYTGDTDTTRKDTLKMFEAEQEIIDICNEALALLQQHLIPFTVEDEAKILYLTMQGDFQSYIAECELGDARTKLIDAAIESYTKASRLADEKLEPTDWLRLHVALQFSTFYRLVLQDHSKARKIATEAYNVGQNASQRTDSTLQSLKDNFTFSSYFSKWEK